MTQRCPPVFIVIDADQHSSPAVVQQKVANELETVTRNADVGDNGPLSDVTNEWGSYGMECSGATSNVLAPAHDSNAGEAQDDTTAPLVSQALLSPLTWYDS